MNTFTYAGIGSRSTPPEILTDMGRLANNLEYTGFTLRSGGANGADSAFEAGVEDDSHKQIFLPWPRFNGNPSRYTEPTAEAYEMAELFHPAWDRCSRYARMFHARNCHQVLGRHLDSPSDFVLCWTPGGQVTGGTGQALRIAQHFGIPVFNMAVEDWDHRFNAWMKWFLEQPAEFRFEEGGVA